MRFPSCIVHVHICLLFFFVPIANVSAQTPEEIGKVPTEKLAAEYTRLLTKGRNFERAVFIIRELLKRDVKNSDYVLALGCAYASRATTLARALNAAKKYPFYQARDKKALQIWKAGQTDSQSPVYGADKPQMTPAPRTSDDGLLFEMETKEAEDRIKALSLAAWQRLDEGVLLRETEKAPRRAEALQAKGWGRAMLYLDARVAVPGSWPEKKTEVLTQVIKPLQEASELLPTSLSYLRSWGDACGVIGSHSNGMNPALRTRGAETLQKVATRTPDDGLLKSYIFMLGARPGSGTLFVYDENTIELMRQGTKSDPSNAFVWYGLFGAYGEVGKYEEAMAALDAGNAAVKLERLCYSLSPHKWVVWAFPPVAIDPKRSLLHSLKNTSKVAFGDKDNLSTEAMRWERAVLAMSHRYNVAFNNIPPDSEDRATWETDRFIVNAYAQSMATWFKGDFPSTEDDKRLLVEAQNVIKRNDAILAAEQAMGTHPSVR